MVGNPLFGLRLALSLGLLLYSIKAFKFEYEADLNLIPQEGRLRKLTFADEYDAALALNSNNVLQTVNLMSQRNDITETDFTFLVSKLQDYQNSGVIVNMAMYSAYILPVISLLSVDITINSAYYDSAFALLLVDFSLINIVDNSSNDEIAKALSIYVSVEKENDPSPHFTSAHFFSSLNFASSIIRQICLKLIQYTLANNEGYNTGSFVGTSSTTSITYRKFYHNSNNPNPFTCTCTECNQSTLLCEVRIEFSNLGPGSTIYYYELDVCGTSLPVTISSNCLSTSDLVSVEPNSGGYACSTTNTITKNCDAISGSSNEVALPIKGNGLYLLVKQCTDNQVYNVVTYACDSCKANCKCLVANGCDSCIGPWEYDSVNKICVCPAGTGLVAASGQCTACGLGCTCAIGGECDACTSSGYSVDSINKKCVCSAGTGFDSQSSSCTPCGSGCICAVGGECDACANSGYSVDSINKKCVCSIGTGLDSQSGLCTPCGPACTCAIGGQCDACTTNNYIFNSINKVCELCSVPYCDQCNPNDKLKCIACTTGFTASFDQTSCNCPSGSGINAGTNQCEPCDSNCNCAMSSGCDSCLTQNYIYDAVNEKCEACAVPYCNQCSITDKNKCDTCKTGFSLNADFSSCYCPAGTILDSQLAACENCKSNCNCSSKDGCSSCIDPVHYIYDTVAQQCDTCQVDNCDQCLINDKNSCDVCKAGFTTVDKSSCFCPDGRAYNSGSKLCESCMSNCKCDSPGSCKSCLDTSIYTYDSTNSVCFICSIANCNQCSSSNQAICSNCNTGYIKSVGGNSCGCFGALNCDICDAVNDKCVVCKVDYKINVDEKSCGCELDANCDVCDNLGSTCATCKPNHLLNANNRCQAAHYCLDTSIATLIFSSIFDKIVLSLNTNLASSTGSDCSYYLTDITKLGTGPTCQVIGKKLIITLGTGFSIRSGDSLSTNPNFYAAEGVLALTCSSQTFTAMYTPGTNPNPVAEISGPSSITYACSNDGDTLYSSSSYGFGIGSFIYAWKVNSVDLSSNDQTISIHNSDYKGLTSITIELKVTNSIGYYATTSLVVTVAENGKISLQIDSGASATYKVSEAILLSPINIKYCNLLGGVSFSWAITPTPSVAFDLTGNKLRIPKRSLNGGVYDITLTMSLTNTQTITGQATTQINMLNSDLIATIDKTDQKISNLLQLDINGGKSKDPDALSIAYQWSVEGIQLAGETFSSLSLTPTYLSTFTVGTSFTVTLTVSGSNSRTASASVTFTIDAATSYIISTTPINSRVPVSTQNHILASISGTSEATFTWTQVSGPSISIKEGLPLLIIPANKLTQGSSYSFTVTATISSPFYSTNTFISFIANKAPACGTGLIVNPLTGTSLITQFSVNINNCYDEDYINVPLSYKIYYARVIPVLVSTSVSSSRSGLRIPKGVLWVSISVCDTLNDCMNPLPVSVSIISSQSRSRNLKSSAAIMDEYKQYLISFDIIYTLSLLLNEYKMPGDILDMLWNDFTIAMNLEFKDNDFITKVAQTVYLFMGPEQDQTLVHDRIEIYITYLIEQIKTSDTLSNYAQRIVRFIVDAIIQIDSSMKYIQIAESLIAKIFKSKSLLGSETTIENTEHFAAYEIETFADLVGIQPIVFGSTSISISDLKLSNRDIVSVEAYSYSLGDHSDIVHVKLTTDMVYADGVITYKDSEDIKLPADTVVISIPYSSVNHAGCSKFNGVDWEEIDCWILSTSDGIAKMSIRSNGFYKITNANYLSASNFPLFLIFSFIFLAAASVPLLIYLDKRSAYFSIPVTSNGFKTDRSVNLPTEIQSKENSQSIILYHLSISIIIGSNDFSKMKKVFIIAANIVMGIFLQGVFLKHTSLAPFVCGIMSVLIVMPVSAFMLTVMREVGKPRTFAGLALILGLFVGSSIGMHMIKAQQGWEMALCSGLAAEFLFSQSLIMLARFCLEI